MISLGEWTRLIPKVEHRPVVVSRYPDPWRNKKMDKMSFSAPLGSVCRRRYHYVTMDCVGVKSLVEHYLKVRSLESILFSRYFCLCAVLRVCIMSGPSLLTEYYRLCDSFQSRAVC